MRAVNSRSWPKSIRGCLRVVSLLSVVILAATSVRGDAKETNGLLGKGTRWKTPYYLQQSDQPGPILLIVGGVHGDEPAGAAAAEQIRRWPIRCGTLAVLPRANPPALAARTRVIPGVEGNVRNLNRNFPKAGHPGPGEGEPAQAIWAWVRSLKPTWVIDLHEGGGTRAAGSKSVGSSVIVQPSPEADAAAKLMLGAVNATIEDERRRFVRLGPPVDGGLARAAAEHLGARTMIVETSILCPPPSATSATGEAKAGSTKNPGGNQAARSSGGTRHPLSLRVRQHRIMVRALLAHLGMIDPSLDSDQLAARRAARDKAWVALYDAGGTGGDGPAALERILGGAGMNVLRIGPNEIVAGGLRGFDLVLFPGGSGSAQAAAIGATGRQQVRQFVEGGGGYIGICAGAYLATTGYDWSLKILNAKTISPKWRRGRATLKLGLTPEGRKILGDRPNPFDVKYHCGPVVTRADAAGLPEYEVLAFFRSEVADNGTPPGIMVNSPALAAARYGKGRVLFVSPHPEQTAGLEDLVKQAAIWTAGRD
jgi:putative intracellular protease/amidase